LDVYDGKEIERLQRYFSPQPIILLNSCSTGATKHGIGAVISKALGGIVFAPSIPAAADEVILDPGGKILGAMYHSESGEGGAKNTRIFENGKMLPYPR
jgi:hypothetical protein